MLSMIIGFLVGLAASLTALLREGKAYAFAGTLGMVAFVLACLGRFGFLGGSYGSFRGASMEIMGEHYVAIFTGVLLGVIYVLYEEGMFDPLFDFLDRQTTQSARITHIAQAGQKAAPRSATLMGTASSNFKRADLDLDLRAETLVRLSIFVLSGLSRQAVIAVENNLGIMNGQRIDVQRLIAKTISQRGNASSIIKPLARTPLSAYHEKRSMFYTLCKIAYDSRSYDKKAMRRLIEAAKTMGLDKTETEQALIKNGLVG